MYDLADHQMTRGLEAYCMFVGTPYSGHTLVASLLDAHPNIIIAHELDALGLVENGIRRDELFRALIARSEAFTQDGRSWFGYKYLVSNQWHSRARTLKVLGDKKGGGSTQRLSRNRLLLDRLREVVQLPLRIIHVVRNPYDNLATLFRRHDAKRPMADIIPGYASACRLTAALSTDLGQDEFFQIRHENVIRDARGSLNSLLSFLGVEAPPDYLDDSASIVYTRPHRSRFDISWNKQDIETVDQICQEHLFLRGYTFEFDETDSP